MEDVPLPPEDTPAPSSPPARRGGLRGWVVPLYWLAIKAYSVAIWLAQPFVLKARLWVQGRKGWAARLQDLPAGGQVVWVHCASLGEFEQGRPVIEAIRSQYPGVRIVLTFFSPSGYEVRKNYPHADVILYLPADGPLNAKRFVQLARPTVAIFVKYELWYFYLRALRRQGVQTLLLSANYPPGHKYSRGIQGALFAEMMANIRHVFAQNEATRTSLALLVGPANVTVSGDTRFDRVTAIAGSFNKITSIGWFTRQRFTVVCGSTWPVDEEIIFKAYEATKGQDVCWVIVPHNLHPTHLEGLCQRFGPQLVRFSEFKEPEDGLNLLLIDNIGMLSRLYHYADLCFVGGGFGRGIHNVLEAAVWGQRVLFGPNYQRFQEAKDLLAVGGARSIATAEDLVAEVRNGLARTPQFLAAQEASKEYVERNTGATEHVMAYLETQQWLHPVVLPEEMEEML